MIFAYISEAYDGQCRGFNTEVDRSSCSFVSRALGEAPRARNNNSRPSWIGEGLENSDPRHAGLADGAGVEPVYGFLRSAVWNAAPEQRMKFDGETPTAFHRSWGCSGYLQLRYVWLCWRSAPPCDSS